MSSPISTRLSNYTLDKAIHSIHRSRTTDAARLVTWVLQLEAKTQAQFQTEVNNLNSAQLVQLREIVTLFETNPGILREFTHSSTIKPTHAQPTDLDGTPIHELQDTLSFFTTTLLTGNARALLVSGPGGIGKTHHIISTLQSSGQDFVRVSGRITAFQLYHELKANNDKIVVLDDTDELMRDSQALSVLRAVLETHGTRNVQWNNKNQPGDNFDYQGSIIVLTNLSPWESNNPALRALVSRTLAVSFSFDRGQLRDYILLMADTVLQDTTPEHREEIKNYIRDNYLGIKTLSLRTLVNARALQRTDPTKWQSYMNRLV